jgi:hypothetical protein
MGGHNTLAKVQLKIVADTIEQVQRKYNYRYYNTYESVLGIESFILYILR